MRLSFYSLLWVILVSSAHAENLKVLSKRRDQDIQSYRLKIEEAQSLIKVLQSSSKRKSLRRRVEKWHKARSRAVLAAFDTKAYPNPGPKKPIRGPYTGYRKVASRFRSAHIAFLPLFELMRESEERLWDPSQQQQRILAIDQLRARIESTERQLRDGGRSLASFEAEDLPFLRALADLKPDIEKACRRGLDFEEPERSLFFIAYSRHIDRHNKTIQTGMDPDALQAIRDLNRFRMSLGFLPLQTEPTLARAVEGHLREMDQLRYFGHTSPTPEKQTPGMRGLLAGWKGEMGENLSTSNPEDAILLWRWDGGHCRIMIDPSWTHAGMGWNGGSGLNVGRGIPTLLPRHTFFPPPSSTKGR